jgi:hypothetical protein
MHRLVKLARPLTLILILIAGIFLLPSGWAFDWEPGSQKWEYNPGPDPSTNSGKAIIDIYAELPEYMEMSEELMESQKFRYIYGMMMTRTDFGKDKVKVLFIGQDATHIAEAAKQPGTSGFGARVQSIGNYFGVDQSVATTNAYLSTIKGQYGAFDHIFVEIDESGKPQIKQTAYVDNELWMLSNGRDSEILKKREQFWEWMIMNNPKALKLIIAFGGAARDAWAEFLIGRGAKVGAKFPQDRLKKIQVPETKLVHAGGNNEFPVPIDINGKDIYEILLGRKPDYSNEKDQLAAVESLRKNKDRALELMVFTGGGLFGSGVMNPAQLGGYDLDQVEINGKDTNSIKGLKLSNGFVVKDDIGFTMSTHPSALSRMEPAEASAGLKKSFSRLEELQRRGWKVESDLDDQGRPMVNQWHEGRDYQYGRADIRARYFEFGAPDDRRVSRADASRLDPQTIVAGSRERVSFDKKLLDAAKKSLPSEEKDPKDLWSVRPRQPDTRGIFDRGPGKELAKLLMETLDRDSIFAPKPGKKVRARNGDDATFATHGIDAFYTKTSPETGLFGIHRGQFEKAKALILADPHGIDDWNTSRALTGARGQYLHGLMKALGFSEEYLVIKTVPVGMDGATDEEWEVVRSRTEQFREVAIREALKRGNIELIVSDGKIAEAELKRVFEKLKVTKITVLNVQRNRMEPQDGIQAAGEVGFKLLGRRGSFRAKQEDIPRSHLPWWARIWEGTSGDRVFDALGKDRGGVRALVAPDWVAKQDVRPSPKVLQSIRNLKAQLEENGIRLENERIGDFLRRKGLGAGKFAEIEIQRMR